MNTLRRYELHGHAMTKNTSVLPDGTVIVLAADVEAVEAERDAYKAQCECRYCKGHHCNISVCSKCAFADTGAPHFIQQAHALAAKEAALAEVLRVVSGVVGGARSLYEHYTSPKPDYSRVPKDLSLYVIQPLEELTNGKQ